MCSPPSKMLADLEQKWGMTLLERSKSGVCLTSAGEPVRPFLLLEHSGKAEVSDLLERAHVQSDIHFTAWEDFAITAMVERGLGVSILPGLILQRIPYKIEIRSCSSPITIFDELLHGGCRVSLLLHSKADWVVIAGSSEVGYNSGAGGRKLAKSPFPYFDNKKAPKAEAFDAFGSWWCDSNT